MMPVMTDMTTTSMFLMFLMLFLGMMDAPTAFALVFALMFFLDMTTMAAVVLAVMALVGFLALGFGVNAAATLTLMSLFEHVGIANRASVLNTPALGAMMFPFFVVSGSGHSELPSVARIRGLGRAVSLHARLEIRFDL